MPRWHSMPLYPWQCCPPPSLHRSAAPPSPAPATPSHTPAGWPALLWTILPPSQLCQAGATFPAGETSSGQDQHWQGQDPRVRWQEVHHQPLHVPSSAVEGAQDDRSSTFSYSAIPGTLTPLITSPAWWWWWSCRPSAPGSSRTCGCPTSTSTTWRVSTESSLISRVTQSP